MALRRRLLAGSTGQSPRRPGEHQQRQQRPTQRTTARDRAAARAGTAAGADFGDHQGVFSQIAALSAGGVLDRCQGTVGASAVVHMGDRDGFLATKGFVADERAIAEIDGVAG